MALNSIPVVAIDLTKPPEELVIDLINHDNGTQLTSAQLSFGIPELSNNIHNTRILATAKPNSHLRGSVSISYNRIDIGAIPNGRSTTFPITTEQKVSDLVPAIDAAYSLKLTPNDYIDGPLPTLPHGTGQMGSVDLVASPNSLVFINKLSLSLDRPGILLSDIMTNLVLRGLNYISPTPPVYYGY